jgi:hypothetical protein
MDGKGCACLGRKSKRVRECARVCVRERERGREREGENERGAAYLIRNKKRYE